MTILLLITDDQAVLAHAPWLDGEVVHVDTVGGARRWLAGRSGGVALVAWGPDVVAAAEEHWRLEGAAVAGVPQVVLRVPGAPRLNGAGMGALGLGRIVQFPEGLAGLNRDVWGVEADAA